MKIPAYLPVRLVILSLATSVVFATGSVSLAGEPVAVNKLPEAVTNAITAKFQKAEMLSAERETDNGKVHFEVKIRVNGAIKEVDVTPEGKIIEVEREDKK